MVRLTNLSDAAAVQASIREFRELGRQAFLTRYGFKPSRDYFLRDGEELFDSKPVLAAAFGRQFPERGPLTASEFSGGTAATVRALDRLGFEVVSRAQLRPPTLGETHKSRTDIYEQYGGDKVAGIIKFPGDAVVNVFSDAQGPYADDPPTLTGTFGYRGEGLIGPHGIGAGGNALLEAARINRHPVRFWYRPVGEPFEFLTWCVVIGRAWIDGRGSDGVLRPELDWQLEPVPSPFASGWSPSVLASLEEAEETVEDSASVPEALPTVTYSELVARVEVRGQARRPTGAVRVDFARSAAARRAVLIRCGGKCESFRCTGMPAERNRRGEPILDVDHVLDLARGGEDHPRNMVALCPNCHACKTRGSEVARWRRELSAVAAKADIVARGES